MIIHHQPLGQGMCGFLCWAAVPENSNSEVPGTTSNIFLNIKKKSIQKKQCTLASSAQGTFSSIYHMLGQTKP